MPWEPEDWEAWGESGEPDPYRDAAHAHRVADLVRRIPDASRKIALDLGGATSRLPLLGDAFAEVVTENARGPRGGSRRRRYNVVVAIDDVALALEDGLDRFFEKVHDRLVEGGILLAILPAVSRGVRPLPMRLASEPPTPGADTVSVHEVELQYRLRRRGFHGLRLKRFRVEPGPHDEILVMAVRRTSN